MGIIKDIKIDYGALGDGIGVVASISIANGGTTLTADTPLWVSGDSGKTIQIYDAGDPGGPQTLVAVMTFVSSTVVTLDQPAAVALSHASKQLYWASNDLPKFLLFQADAMASSGICTLKIPAGIYCVGNNNNSITDLFWMRGIPQLQITGTGNPILFARIGVGVGPAGIPNYLPISARIQTAKIGDTTLTLLDPSYSFKFTAGRTNTTSGIVYKFQDQIMIAAMDMQGGGWPMNLFFWELAKVSSINAGTGVITLTAPLSKDGPYLSAYPSFSDPSQPTDVGGPATIWAFDASWDASITITGIRLSGDQTGGGINVKSITWQNCAFLGIWFPNPTLSDVHTFDGCTFSGSVTEFDKHVNVINLNNCVSNSSNFFFQSASIKQLNIANTTIASGHSLNGTVRNTNITNGSVIHGIRIGPQYGRSDSFTASDSTIGDETFTAKGPQNSIASGYILTDGVIDFSGSVSWAIPGSRIMLVGSYDSETMFGVTSYTQPGGVGSHVKIATDYGGRTQFPAVPGLAVLESQPCVNVHITNCTGNAQVIDLCNPGAQGKPIYSYSKRFYNQSNIAGTVAYASIMWGNVVSIIIDVTQAYAGSSTPATMHAFGFNDNYPVIISDFSKVNYGPNIDLRTPGKRIIKPGTAPVGFGADTNLALPDPNVNWLTQVVTTWANYTDANWNATIEIITDQGFGPAPVVLTARPGISHHSIVLGRRIIN